MGDARQSGTRTPRPDSTERDGSTRGKKSETTSTADEASSRGRVIAAAIDCINDLGYYQATSNEIARRAGVSWGVIQYYFGTRERLLVAVIEDACTTTLRELDDVVITGETVAQRLSIWVNEAFAFYAKPEYLAILQILWDVTRRPATADESISALMQWQAQIVAKQQELLTQVAGETAVEHLHLLWSTVWGFSVARATARWYEDLLGPAPDIHADKLVEALAHLLST